MRHTKLCEAATKGLLKLTKQGKVTIYYRGIDGNDDEPNPLYELDGGYGVLISRGTEKELLELLMKEGQDNV